MKPANGILALQAAQYLGLGQQPQSQTTGALTPLQIDPVAQQQQQILARAQQADTINRLSTPLKLVAGLITFVVGYEWIRR